MPVKVLLIYLTRCFFKVFIPSIDMPILLLGYVGYTVIMFMWAYICICINHLNHVSAELWIFRNQTCHWLSIIDLKVNKYY